MIRTLTIWWYDTFNMSRFTQLLWHSTALHDIMKKRTKKQVSTCLLNASFNTIDTCKTIKHCIVCVKHTERGTRQQLSQPAAAYIGHPVLFP